jgi:hypothetical protein
METTLVSFADQFLALISNEFRHVHYYRVLASKRRNLQNQLPTDKGDSSQLQNANQGRKRRPGVHHGDMTYWRTSSSYSLQ